MFDLDGLGHVIAHTLTGAANHLEIDNWTTLTLSKKIEYFATTDSKYWQSMIEYAPFGERETLTAAAKLQGQKMSEVKS